MTLLLAIFLPAAALSVSAWIYLVFFRGFFWRTDIRLDTVAPEQAGDEAANQAAGRTWPKVAAVIPARNEADALPLTLSTVLTQQYPGELSVYLVDDQSDDATAELGRSIAQQTVAPNRFALVNGSPLPPGWAGKVWALEQGTQAARSQDPKYYWFTDADIAHRPSVLTALVEQAENGGAALVSVMARLHCSGNWERLLIPAFVYFFAKLFPFRWVNNRRHPAAAAAGGCILVERQALEDVGGMASIHHAIIDDCALARRIKRHEYSGRGTDGPATDGPVPDGQATGGQGTDGRENSCRRIWLGLSQDVRSVRAYDRVTEVWRMAARTAYTQLGYSPLLLLATVAAMFLVYGAPPAAAAAGLAAVLIWPEAPLAFALLGLGLAGWCLMAGSYLPMLRWHQTPPVYAPLLPLAAMVYTLATVDSARRHWQGRGGAWKGRCYVAYNGRRQAP